MAKQNFLSGGFYGKLGQVVGQRWKNKRTIRSYVIPHDPKTPLQVEQRNAFGKAVIYAQSAMMSNYNSNWFDNPNMSRWNVRMSTARELIKSFTTFLARLPLIPQNVEPPFTVSQIKFTKDPITHDITFTLNSEFPKAKRNISIYATNNPNTQNPDDVLLLVAENQDELWKRFTVPNVQDFTFDNNTHLRIVSNDETNSDRVGFVSNEQVGSQDFIEQYPFDTSLFNVFVNPQTIVIVFEQECLDGRVGFDTDGFDAYINGVKQFISPTIKTAGKMVDYGNRFGIMFENTWGVDEEHIKFGNDCKMSFVYIQVTSNDGGLRFRSENVEITLNKWEYFPITPFNAAVNDVVCYANDATVTFANQDETPQEFAIDNVTVMYEENGVQKSKLINSGITPRLNGKSIQITIPLEKWWTTSCDENAQVKFAFSNIRYRDSDNNWHTYTGVETAQTVQVNGYHYKQSDFTYEGISFSGTNATVSYSYKVANGNGLDAATTKTCGEIKYHSSAEPITKANPTVGSITTTNGKLQITLGGIDNTGEHYTLSTDTMTNLVLKGLNKTVSSNVYSDCEDLSFSQTFTEMNHKPLYFKPKAVYTAGEMGFITTWDNVLSGVTYQNKKVLATVNANNNGTWENAEFNDCSISNGNIKNDPHLLIIAKSAGIERKVGWNAMRVNIPAVVYTHNGTQYTTQSWSNVNVEWSLKGGAFSSSALVGNTTKNGNILTCAMSYDVPSVPTWQQSSFSKNGCVLVYKDSSTSKKEYVSVNVSLTASGKVVTLTISNFTGNIDNNEQIELRGVQFPDAFKTNNKLEIENESLYSQVPWISIIKEWQDTTITPFNATVNNLVCYANKATVTFANQEETPQEVTVDNVTVEYKENGTQKTKTINSGITPSIAGKSISLAIPIEKWWTPSCDENSPVKFTFSIIKYRDSNNNWHVFTGTKNAQSVQVNGYHYKQSDFTYAGISFSGTNATVSYSYKVANGNGLDAVTTKTCGEIKYHSSAEPVTKTNPTVGSITTTNGKLQITLGGIDNTGEHYTLSTDTMANLVLQGLNKTVSSNVYSDCENLNFSQTFTEMNHKPLYFKPKAVYTAGEMAFITTWDNVLSGVTYSSTYIQANIEMYGENQWEDAEFGDCFISDGNIKNDTHLLLIFESSSNLRDKFWSKTRVTVPQVTYTYNGTQYTAQSWQNVEVEWALKGGAFSKYALYKNITKSGYTLKSSLTYDLPSTPSWRQSSFTESDCTLVYMSPSTGDYDNATVDVSLTASGKTVTLTISNFNKSIDDSEIVDLQDVTFPLEFETNNKLEIENESYYTSVAWVTVVEEWA